MRKTKHILKSVEEWILGVAPKKSALAQFVSVWGKHTLATIANDII
ncbi:hypothetical protein [Mastigocoleus testarum]|nr:hypothetical protein [Mastigocoleus testarum]